MSHQPERKEKNCLNCGATVVGRYCHVCGQENVETKESFWSLSKHFVFDILHFDGKFWHTLKYLITRPGLVARQYCEGRRNSFLHPIRMYLFTSAIFFLIFFSVGNSESEATLGNDILKKEDRVSLMQDYQKRLEKNPSDTSARKIVALLKDTSQVVTGMQVVALDTKSVFTINGTNYHNLKDYDSSQKSLPASQRDGWFKRMLLTKAFKFNEKYKGRTSEGFRIVREGFLHRLPYLLFISLPFFALILKLLYARRKNFYYSDHAVFTLFHYIVSFILLLLIIGVVQLESWTKLGDFEWIALLLVFVWLGYLLIEMKNFYRQSWGKTIGKFLLLDLLGLVLIFILFFGFIVFSIFEL